jgi:YihY family inner membrane protein
LSEPLARPGVFLLGTLKAFRANQGLLLAGAVAYNALLSIVPMLILFVIALSHLTDPEELLATLRRYLEWIIPGQSAAVIGELGNFLAHREVAGWVLLAVMLFFSSLAFTMLENAMSVIFHHRVAIKRRRFLVSALLPYCFILLLGAGFLAVTLVSGGLQALGERSIHFLGREWSLDPLSVAMLYLLGVGGEILLLTALYLVMPVGRLSFRHALIGGVTAALLWEATRHLLTWYFASVSKVNVVYGSLTTAIVVLLSLEIAATLVLFGAQVIAEYERLERGAGSGEPKPMRTN